MYHTNITAMESEFDRDKCLKFGFEIKPFDMIDDKQRFRLYVKTSKPINISDFCNRKVTKILNGMEVK